MELVQQIHCRDCGRESRVVIGDPVEDIPVKTGGLTEMDLRAKHDIAFKIKKTAEVLCGDVFYPEFEFIKLCGIPCNGYRHVLESGDFDKYRGKAGGIVYWSNPENIARLKKEGVLK